MQLIIEMMKSFADGWRCGGHVSRTSVIREDKSMRDQRTEDQIDKMLKDSFPASDPPSNY